MQRPAQNVSVPDEPHLPKGRQISTVQPHPMPLIAAAEAGQPVVDEKANQLHVAQMRADITGTGNIMDVIA